MFTAHFEAQHISPAEQPKSWLHSEANLTTAGIKSNWAVQSSWNWLPLEKLQ